MSLSKEWEKHVFPKKCFIGASTNSKSYISIERDDENKWRFCGYSHKKKKTGEVKLKESKISLSKAKECLKFFKKI